MDERPITVTYKCGLPPSRSKIISAINAHKHDKVSHTLIAKRWAVKSTPVSGGSGFHCTSLIQCWQKMYIFHIFSQILMYAWNLVELISFLQLITFNLWVEIKNPLQDATGHSLKKGNECFAGYAMQWNPSKSRSPLNYITQNSRGGVNASREDLERGKVHLSNEERWRA